MTLTIKGASELGRIITQRHEATAPPVSAAGCTGIDITRQGIVAGKIGVD
ncbi:hypothetical protein BQ6471_00959 [Vibrio gazogenes]|nr:hypothetical protein BQ6471_00959 [Vibrio gazogenes]